MIIFIIIIEPWLLKISKTKIGAQDDSIKIYQELMEKNGGKDSIFWFNYSESENFLLQETNVMVASQPLQYKIINGYS